MRTLYLDCSMGCAGDMLTAALLELCPHREAALSELNAMGIPGVVFTAEEAVKCGVRGTHMKVTVHGEEEGSEEHHHHHDGENHHHHSFTDIAEIAGRLNVPDTVRSDILEIYRSIAAAESAVHGTDVTEIHFHEVGALDAVADVAAAALLIRRLAPERICASPVHVGSGQVKCAHGILPVPAPATALLLQGIPAYGGEIRGELCTPTGAALLKHYVNRFGPMPLMSTERIGYGMGKKDFPAANCLRAFWGEAEEAAKTEEMTELCCDLDDMTPEAVSFACQVLRHAGAPEVFTSPVYMKKDRPGILLTVICRPDQRREMVKLMLLHTTTLGVRETALRRYVLERSVTEVDTPLGPVRKKISSGYGVTREKYEHDDLARLAREQSCTLEEILSRLEK